MNKCIIIEISLQAQSGHNINIFTSSRDLQTKIDHITSFRADILRYW